MSNTQGEQPVSIRTRIIIGTITAAAIAAIATGIGIAAHGAQVQADAEKAMVAAAPAYQGTISLGGNLDQLAAESVQAKATYDAEQARLAAERAAQEAAAQAAAAAAAQAAADEAARQAAAQAEDTSNAPISDDSSDAPAQSGLPSGTPVPFVNGYYDTTQCASSSASTVNGVPTCD